MRGRENVNSNTCSRLHIASLYRMYVYLEFVWTGSLVLTWSNQNVHFLDIRKEQTPRKLAELNFNISSSMSSCCFTSSS